MPMNVSYHYLIEHEIRSTITMQIIPGHYIERESERDSERDTVRDTQRERERERERDLLCDI